MKKMKIENIPVGLFRETSFLPPAFSQTDNITIVFEGAKK
jgi:hypothetical protein